MPVLPTPGGPTRTRFSARPTKSSVPSWRMTRASTPGWRSKGKVASDHFSGTRACLIRLWMLRSIWSWYCARNRLTSRSSQLAFAFIAFLISSGRICRSLCSLRLRSSWSRLSSMVALRYGAEALGLKGGQAEKAWAQVARHEPLDTVEVVQAEGQCRGGGLGQSFAGVVEIEPVKSPQSACPVTRLHQFAQLSDGITGAP